MEKEILALLAQGSLAPQQIAAHLRADEEEVRTELAALQTLGLIDLATVTPYSPDMNTDAVYWRINAMGEARLEQLRSGGT